MKQDKNYTFIKNYNDYMKIKKSDRNRSLYLSKILVIIPSA